jgi:hypothetical protein
MPQTMKDRFVPRMTRHGHNEMPLAHQASAAIHGIAIF